MYMKCSARHAPVPCRPEKTPNHLAISQKEMLIALAYGLPNVLKDGCPLPKQSIVFSTAYPPLHFKSLPGRKYTHSDVVPWHILFFSFNTHCSTLEARKAEQTYLYKVLQSDGHQSNKQLVHRETTSNAPSSLWRSLTNILSVSSPNAQPLQYQDCPSAQLCLVIKHGSRWGPRPYPTST